MKPSLPNVTLIGVETRAHELAAAALADTASRANFGDVIVYSDRPLNVPGARHIAIPDYQDKIAFGRFYYTEAAQAATTSHVLLTEWDAGLNDPTIWSDEFLQYDYIGAPWPWLETNGLSVGNGGFSLWSKRLCDFVYANQHRWLIATDVHISQHFRRAIAKEGDFRWAPHDVALRFAYEGWTYNGPEKRTTVPASFGFHAVYNWPLMFSRAELIERTRMLMRGRFPDQRCKVRMLLNAAPWLQQQGTLP